jgi:hypothetical protein
VVQLLLLLLLSLLLFFFWGCAPVTNPNQGSQAL